VYPLIPAFRWTFEKGNDKLNLIHDLSEGTHVAVKLGLNIMKQPSQVLKVPLERLNVKLVVSFPRTMLL
jgi:hypothetical protein